ncbi:hypothetical protein [Buttiauxella noackiae]|uniref:hypothetical protein n=1 Tax=Buttiauxella noackiae TaxID=82992 RepID=UPI001428D11C|nr:hypothetical protein [Buttiauxella noackiae]
MSATGSGAFTAVPRIVTGGVDDGAGRLTGEKFSPLASARLSCSTLTTMSWAAIRLST